MKPRLRAVEGHAIQHQGQPMVLLLDPLHLSDVNVAVPRPLVPLLGLMDGTRDEAGLEAALELRAAVRLAPGLLARLLSDLDEAFLLDNERSAQAKADALDGYRTAPFRSLITLGGNGPDLDASLVTNMFQGFVDALPPLVPGKPKGRVRGLVSPHIDYQRGGRVYAQVWRQAAQAVREAELVIILGTDHQGSDGALTLTRQSYATPWGVLPTDQPAIDGLAAALGEEAAFDEELHHQYEHSIELAAMWLHHVRGGKPVAMAPILCGGFGDFVNGTADPASHPPFAAAVDVLRAQMANRRTLVVAAADLAHMGPEFGDPYGLDAIATAQLRNADERLLHDVYRGDAAGFYEQLRTEDNRRHVCGLPPIYLMLRLLDGAHGEPAGYDVCPADQQGLSYVSIAGAILY